jgi:L-seryl-tRNA(Ser) seleniumtransferase
MSGFVADVSVREIAMLGRERGVPVVHDMGSGLLLSLESHGLAGEPTAMEAVRNGSTVVTMSGDKLLGGPQAGILLGDAKTIRAIRENPLTRSYRVDKLTLAALEATLALYRDPARAMREIPALAMLTAGVDVLRSRALRMAADIGNGATVVESEAGVGGGAFPSARIPSAAVAIPGGRAGRGASELEGILRSGRPPIVARVRDDQLLLDVRTLFPHEDELVVAAARAALA